MTIDNLYEKALAEMTKPTPDLELVKGLLEQSHSGGDPRATYALLPRQLIRA